MNWQKHIEINEKILVGKPLIKGTRISIEYILELLAHGWNIDKIIKNYPQLKEEDINAALEYSAHAIKLQTVYSI